MKTIAVIRAEVAAELAAERLARHADRMRRARADAKAERMARETAAEAVERACRASVAATAREAAKRATCGICARVCECRWAIPAGNDARWRAWAAMPRSAFTEGKWTNVLAFIQNDAADKARPVGTVDCFGRRDAWLNRGEP